MTELPRPRDVPGFATSAAGGLTPARPAAPPAVRRPTAHQALVRFAVIAAASVGAAIACVFFAPVQHRLDGATLPVFLSVLAVGFVVQRRALIRFRTTFLGELQAGYTTTTFLQGGFWMSDRSGRRADEGLGWSWEGLWTLTSDGRVVSAPDPAVDPPGVYPSAAAPGRRELWTGYEWSGVFFDSGPR